MARYAKAEFRSEDGETVVKARFDIASYDWRVQIAGPVTNPANRRFLEDEWETTLQNTTNQLQIMRERGPAQGAPWAFYFAETCRALGFQVTDALAPGKPDSDPLEY